MTHQQTRHQADRRAPRPEPIPFVLGGWRQPDSAARPQPTSLFGVPQQVARGEAASRPAPRRNWPHLLGFPLAVLLLGVALGVISVVLLVAAGAPAPWAAPEQPRVSSTMPGQDATRVVPSGEPAAPVATAGRIASEPSSIEGDGVHLIGRSLRPGRYTTATAVPDCHWARLAGAAGERRVLVEGAGGARRTTVTIRRTDTVFRTSGCGTWVRR